MNIKSWITLMHSLSLVTMSCNRSLSSRNAKDKMVFSELNNMWVKKGPYYQGDEITIFFSKNHPDELGIKNPNGDFFYLIYPSNLNTIPNTKPILPQSKFKMLSEINLIAGETKANPHNLEFKNNQAVFTESGTYTFLLSQNLSTDALGPAETVKIDYIHQPRRNRS